MPYVPQIWSPEKLLERRRAARLAPYHPLLLSGLTVAAGIVADRYASLGLGWLVIAIVAWAVWCLLWRRNGSAMAAVALLVCLASSSAAWRHAHWRLFPDSELGRFAKETDAPVCLEAIAIESPARRAAPENSPYRAIPGVETSQLNIRIARLRDGAAWRSARGSCQLTVEGHLLGVSAGDRLRVFGRLSAPIPSLNPGEFDYAADRRAQGQLSLLWCESPDCVIVKARGSSLSLTRWLDQIRNWGERVLSKRLGPEQGDLAAAMIVGAQDRLPQKIVETFRRAGALHVLVVSGLHVGLVISSFYFFARMGWAPRGWSLAIVMLAILGYALVTGARPPVVRAAVLAELMCFALWHGRTVLAMNSLGAAAIVVLAMNPCELFRTGAQLSFLSAATLIWFGRRSLDRREAIDPMTRLLRSAESLPRKALRATTAWLWLLLLATAAVWIVAAPLMLYRYHLLSPVAAPLAAAVFPLVSVSVVGGLLTLVAEFAAPPLAPLLAPLSRCGCHALHQVVQYGESSPVPGHFYSPSPALWWVLSAYLLMLLGLRYGMRPRVRRALTHAALLLIVAGAAPPAIDKLRGPAPDAPLRCTFIAVGHGVSVLIEPPQGGAVLYDAGSMGSPRAAAERISAVLWSKGITRLDAVFLSHPDVDHFGAVPTLLERFRINQVLTTNQMFPHTLLPDEHLGPAELLRLLKARRVPIHRLAMADRINLGGATAEVLHPTPLGVIDSDNANSLVLGIEFAGRRVLLPGDLEGRGLEEVIAQEPYDCDVLLAPHHGSPRSDPPGFAAWCQPEKVIISAASGVYSSEAALGYREAGAEVWSTCDTGAVTIEVTHQGVAASRFLP